MATQQMVVLNGNNQRNYTASFQKKSSNSKLSLVDLIPHPNGRFQTNPKPPYVCSTYVSISATCPSSCRFKDNGCYVQTGNALVSMRRLDNAASATGVHPNRLEAELIDRQWNSEYHTTRRRVPQDGKHGGRDLRLHVGGDVKDKTGARALAAAVERWRSRGGGDAWTYTHRWRKVPVEAFGSIVALASVEKSREAEEAVDLGYTPSFTMSGFREERAYREGAIKVVPCPAQTRNLKCVDCRLCMRRLPKGTAIGFKWHGRQTAAKRQLDVIGQEMSGQRRLELT